MLNELISFFENSNEPVAIINSADELIVHRNEEFLRKLGLRKNQKIIGISLDEALNLNETGEIRLARATIEHEGKKYGLIRLVDAGFNGVKDEQKPEDSHRLELIIKTIPDSFYIIDRDGHYREFYSLEEKSGTLTKDERKTLADRNLPKKVEIRILANLERGLETMDPQLFYYDLERDGEIVDLEARLIPFNNNEALIIIRDVSEFNRSKRELLEVNDRLRKVLDNVNHIIYDIKISKEGTQEFQYISPQIEKVYGYTIDEYKAIFKENRELELYHPEDIGSIKQKSKELREDKKPISHTYRFKRKDSKKYIYIQEDVFPKTNEKGKYNGNFGIAKDVTEKVMAERQLQERERALSTLFNHLPGMAYRCSVDDHWTMQVLSTGCYNLTGYTREELIGNKKVSYASLIHPDFKNKSSEQIVNELDSLGEYSFEYKIFNKDGSDRWVWDQGEVVKDENGITIALEGYIADLTERKDSEQQKIRAELAEEANIALEEEIQKRIIAQEELATTQKLTNSIIHSSIDTIMAADRDGKITTVSPSALRAFGYSAKELMGLKGSELYHSSSTYAAVMHKLKSKGQFTGEVENITKDGKVFISYLSASILRDKNGMEIGSMGVSRDITKIKKAENEIIMQKRKLESIFESSANMMIYTIDKEFKITSFNRRFAEIMKTRFNANIKLGSNFIEHIKNHIKSDYHENLERLYKRATKGEALEFEGPMVTTNGNMWIETFLSPIIVGSQTKEISCLAHEVTDKKMAEWKLKESIAEKDVLLKEVHHRVKNNLQVISSILNLQTSRITDDNSLNIIRESQDRIKSMSFIHESLYQTTNFSSIKFYDYIDNLSRNLVQTYAYEKNIKLETNLERVDVSLDQAIPCGLVLNELISNALKYAFRDTSEGTLRISLKEEKNEIEIKVEDNGVGMPEGFRVENTESLGLQLVQTLIEQLEGTIKLSTNEGTKYLITFVKQP